MENHKQFFEEVFPPRWILEENKAILENLNKSLKEYNSDIYQLKLKLSKTYRLMIWFSSVLFLTGIFFMVIPVVLIIAGFPGLNLWALAGSAGLGLLDVISLLLYGPIDRIHKNMGDMSQIMLVLNSYQYQVGLHLIEIKIDEKKSVGQAAEKIGEVAMTKIAAIEKYFENKDRAGNRLLKSLINNKTE